MNKYAYLTIFILCITSTLSQAQASITGTWKTIDDVTGEAKSHVEIYEMDGAYYGKIVKLLRDNAASICESCKGAKKNQPLIGLVVMDGLTKQDDSWGKGTIMDPENGKTYKCKISFEDEDKLKVRGYIGIEALGRNQYWTRIQ